MKRWRWPRLDVLYAVHDRQVSEHGGLEGVSDANALEFAMARPQNQAAYEEPDAAALAAAYAFGLATNHGFADGNKRTAWVIARVFLADHGYALRFDPHDAVRVMESVAAGSVSEQQLGAWFR